MIRLASCTGPILDAPYAAEGRDLTRRVSGFGDLSRDSFVDGYALGPVRVALGGLLAWHALASTAEFESEASLGQAFQATLVPTALLPSARVYGVILALRVCLAVMVVFAIGARSALFVSAFIGSWLLACESAHVQAAPLALYGFSLLLSLTPCDRSWRSSELNDPVPRTRKGQFSAARLAQLQVSFLYFVSGVGHILDSEWRSGLGFASVVLRPDLSSALAKLTIMSEFAICGALAWHPTRVVALWWGVWFHLGLAAALGVDVTKLRYGLPLWLTFALYGLFVTPDFRARKVRFDPLRFWGKATLILVPWFDWFGRFDLAPWEPDCHLGHSVVVERRDGEKVTGIRALAMVARCIPMLFPFWGPLALVASFTRKGDLTPSS